MWEFSVIIAWRLIVQSWTSWQLVLRTRRIETDWLHNLEVLPWGDSNIGWAWSHFWGLFLRVLYSLVFIWNFTFYESNFIHINLDFKVSMLVHFRTFLKVIKLCLHQCLYSVLAIWQLIHTFQLGLMNRHFGRLSWMTLQWYRWIVLPTEHQNPSSKTGSGWNGKWYLPLR